MAFTMKKSGKIDDFHTRSRAVTEEEIRAGLEIFQEIGINPNVFVAPCWKLNLNTIEVLEKLRFKLSELQEKYVLLSPRRSKNISYKSFKLGFLRYSSKKYYKHSQK